MTAVACTGHQRMPDAAVRYAQARLPGLLRGLPPLVGVTSLAAGADQLFARAVLSAGGALHVVVPCGGYASTFGEPADRSAYEELLAAAERIDQLPYPDPSEEAFYAAGKAVVDAADRLIAVWDGGPARGLGGAADVVAYARTQGRDVDVVWPDGVTR